MNWIIESIRLFNANIFGLFYFIRGLYWLSGIKTPIITIFGGRSKGVQEKYEKHAHEVAYLLVERGYSVLSGGGPGMMQASNCGAFEASLKDKDRPIRSFGIGVKGVDEDFVNICAPVLMVHSFFTRKWLLTRYSSAYVILPGGIGTMDELFDTLNLMKLGKLERKPIILLGAAYWEPVVDWIEKMAIEQGFIQAQYRELFYVTDDPIGAVRIIEQSLGRKQVS